MAPSTRSRRPKTGSARRPRQEKTAATRDEALPRSVAVLWQRSAGRPRKAPRALSLDRIAAAAIQLADSEGLAALSMARLAERLGCSTMALYRHVASKDELHVVMTDIAGGPAPEIPAESWRDGLEAWARQLRAVYYRHPWILQVTAGRPPLEPGALSWLDSGLRCLAESRLGPRDKLAVVLLVLYYVRGEAQVATGLLQAHHRTRQEEAELQGWYGRMLATVVEPSRFPALSELIAAGVFDASTEQPPGEEPFELGLQRLLDGIGVMPAG